MKALPRILIVAVIAWGTLLSLDASTAQAGKRRYYRPVHHPAAVVHHHRAGVHVAAPGVRVHVAPAPRVYAVPTVRVHAYPGVYINVAPVYRGLHYGW